jgi:hypothetical protein
MKNIHTRTFDHPIAFVRPWIALAWSGSHQDIFPRDVVPTWRQNADGSQGLIPGVTKLGHGPFVFTLRWWDGVRWRADLDSDAGWHGVHLLAVDKRKTKVIHTLDATMSLATRLAVVPIHDWAVEAMFDRLGLALATGAIPAKTERPMGFLAQRMFDAMRLRQGLGKLALAGAR